MSHVATIDVVVQLRRFVNVDLISQGLYFVMVKISDPTGGTAKPYDFTVDGPMKRSSDEWEAMTGARLDSEKRSGCSKHFYVRYVEQTVALLESFNFTVSIDTEVGMGITKEGTFGDQLDITFELFHVSKDRLEKMNNDTFSRQRGSEGRYENYSAKTSKQIAKALKEGKSGVKVNQKDSPNMFIDLNNMTEVLEDGHARRIVRTPQAAADNMFKSVAKVVIPYKASLIPHSEWVPVTFNNWYFARTEVVIKSSITAIHSIPSAPGSSKASTPSSSTASTPRDSLNPVHVSYLLYALAFFKFWGKHITLHVDPSDVSIDVSDSRSVETGLSPKPVGGGSPSSTPRGKASSPRGKASSLTVTATERVQKLLDEEHLLQLCHFYGNKGITNDVIDALKTVQTMSAAPGGIMQDGETPADVLLRLSQGVTAAWGVICSSDTAGRKFNEGSARKAFFSYTSSYYKSLLNQTEAPLLPPKAPQYYDYPAFTEISINEIQIEPDDPRSISPRGETDISQAVSPASIDLGMQEGAHVIVFVHGWKGHSGDFHLLKNYLELYLPEGIHYLACQSMQAHPNDSILQLGERVAAEVDEFISQIGPVQKLTFVGHSMGTLVTRSCLRSSRMSRYLDKLYTFFSFSGPHLGVAISESKTIGCAIGFLSTFKRSKNIRELRLDDSYLHTLSTCNKIGLFKHVLLFGSEQDGFVGFDSALAFPTEARSKLSASTSKKKSMMVSDIARNLTASSIQNTTLRRFAVRFNPQGRKQLTNWMDKLIGKDVHISFIINVDFMHAVINNFKNYF
eukprot:TRINITY_DN258_c1_g1_i1.p1 TRINITY_DN258_c1_g1~~TRINITY_DN258_c1_g1_i1.p1  ORF type:complete len:805 (+),score=115.84 TRINITY_DN258_c1_g1_i1:36-2417(+)